MNTKIRISTKLVHIYWQSFEHFCGHFVNIFVRYRFWNHFTLSVLYLIVFSLLFWLLFYVIIFLCYHFCCSTGVILFRCYHFFALCYRYILLFLLPFDKIILDVIIFLVFSFLWSFHPFLLLLKKNMTHSPNSGNFFWFLVSDIAITKS